MASIDEKTRSEFFIVTSTFLASTFTPFLSKVTVVPFSGGSFTIITGAAGTIMTSFLVSAGLQDIIVKIAANEMKPMIFFIKKFELKTLHFVTTLTCHTASIWVKHHTRMKAAIMVLFRHIGMMRTQLYPN